MSRDPKNAREWQEAVDLAETLLLIAAARDYGLIAGGPAINVDRCDQIRNAGARRGVVPDPDAVRAIVQTYARGDE